jgi:hypothetical protein
MVSLNRAKAGRFVFDIHKSSHTLSFHTFGHNHRFSANEVVADEINGAASAIDDNKAIASLFYNQLCSRWSMKRKGNWDENSP